MSKSVNAVLEKVSSQSFGGLRAVSSTHHGVERDTSTNNTEHPNTPGTFSPIIISQNSDVVVLNTTTREEVTDSNTST